MTGVAAEQLIDRSEPKNLGLAPQAMLRRCSAANNELRRRSAAGRDGQEVV